MVRDKRPSLKAALAAPSPLVSNKRQRGRVAAPMASPPVAVQVNPPGLTSPSVGEMTSPGTSPSSLDPLPTARNTSKGGMDAKQLECMRKLLALLDISRVEPDAATVEEAEEPSGSSEGL